MSLDTVTPEVFCSILDAVSSTLQYAHVVSDGALAVVSGTPFGSPSAEAPIRVTAIRASDGARCHYLCTGVTGNSLTIGEALDGYDDIALAIGDTVSVTVNSGTLADVHATILANQAAINQHAAYAATLASPALTGVPTAPTAAANTDTTQIATTAFVIGQGYDTAAAVASYVAGLGYATLASPSFSGTVTIAALSGILKGATGAVEVATAGTDYVAPGTATSFTKQQNFGTATLTDGASIAWDVSVAQAAKVTLAGDRTLAGPSNLVDGGTYLLRVIQDGTGSRTLAYNAVFKWPGGTAPTLSTAAGAIDVLTFLSDGTHLYGVAQLAFA